MITIGLTTWKKHPALIQDVQRDVTLPEYAAVLPVVELDTYTVSQERRQLKIGKNRCQKSFQFILKANKLMTKHDYGQGDG